MKRRFTLAVVSLAIFSSALVVTAETKPVKPKLDFSGAWLLDLKKSDQKQVLTRPDLPMKSSHQDPEFRVITTSESNGQPVQKEFIYYTDGRGENNHATTLLTTSPASVQPHDIEKKVTKSKTTWSGEKVVTRSNLRLLAGGHVVEFELIEEWKLSRDGNVLTKTTRTVFQQSDTVFVPVTAPDKKTVYNRR